MTVTWRLISLLMALRMSLWLHLRLTCLTLLKKQEEIETKFPKHKIIVTQRPLFNLIETLDQLEKLEAAMIADGDLIDSKPTGRIVDAFNWNKKHDGARQRGHC